MKYQTAIIFSLFIFFLASCKNEAREKQIIQRAEAWFNRAPDSVLHILDSIPLPEEMSPSLATQWSMLYARSADRVGKEMPYVSQLQIAFNYYKNKKQLPEAAEAGLYLGRSYVMDKEYAHAMQTYTDALEIALDIKDYNRAGYICSYMGDLYRIDEDHVMAANKYEEGNYYFFNANNQKSYAFGLVNEAFCYAVENDPQTALSLLQKADTVATSLNYPEVMSYVYNGLGNVYLYLKEYNVAESYILKGIQMDSTDLAPYYVSLAGIYLCKKDYRKAEHYLNKAQRPTKNRYTPAAINYKYYELKKEEGKYQQALQHLEHYMLVEDSIDKISQNINILDIERKYNHVQIQDENKKLKIDKQNHYILLSISFSICTLLFIIYLLMLTRKNKHIQKQQKTINQLNKNIYKVSTELQQKNKDLLQQFNKMNESKQLLQLQGRLEDESIKYQKLKETIEVLNKNLIVLKKDRILLSSVAKKLRKMSQTVKPNPTQPLISDRYWHTIEEQVTEVYPALETQMDTFELTNAERHFCYLTLFQLDTTALSVLLNIIPESVNKQRLRVRQKFDLVGKSIDLYQYLSKF